MSAQRTSAASQSLTTEFSSPPTYWIGLRTRGSSGSSREYTDSTGIPPPYRPEPAQGPGGFMITEHSRHMWPRMFRDPGNGRGRASVEDGVAAVDGLEHADGDHVGEHGGAAVGHERQRQPGDRRDPDRHPDVNEGLDSEPDRDAGGHQQAELVVGADRDAQRADQQHGDQADDRDRADEAQFLSGHREYEVGVLLGHEVAGDQRAMEQSLAEHPTRADRDLRLRGAVPGSRRGGRRVDERGEALDLVGLE